MRSISFLAQVENQADPAGEVQEWTSAATEFLMDRGTDWAVNLLAALAIFIIGRWIAKFLCSWFERVMGRANVDETLSAFLGNIAYGLLITLVIMAAVNRLGVNTTSFAAVLAAAGLAIGLALQSSLSNFAAGVMIVLFRPFKVGDYVEAGGTAGVVEEIHIFSTFMRTGDNRQVIVPNGAIIGGVITNNSTKPTRRIDMVVGCGYNDDLRAVKEFLEQMVAGDERVLKDPEPVVAVHELGDSCINFVVRPWVNSGDYWAVLWDFNEAIKLGFDESGFTIPYPSSDVYMHQAAQ